MAGRALYVLLCLSMLAAYFHFFCPAVSDNPRAYMFVMLLVLVFFVLSALLERNVALGIYLVPVAVVAVLMQVFFDGRTAIVTTIVLTVLCAAIASFPLEYIFMESAASCAAVYSLREVSRRSQMLRASARKNGNTQPACSDTAARKAHGRPPSACRSCPCRATARAPCFHRCADW